MADKKISALTPATTPLDGTEVLPLVQSGSTVKVANNDLRPKQIQSNATSGVLQVVGPASATTRVMTTPNANFTAARTDAAQTFTGDQTLNDRLGIGEAPNASYNLWVKSARPNFINNTNSAGDGLIIRAASTAGQQALDISTYDGGIYLFRVRGDGRVIVDSGDISLLTGNLIIGTNGKGIDFSATPGTGTSELLDDYEEGTWTPELQFGGASVDITYIGGYQNGLYTKVGNLVTLTAAIYTSSKGTSTGNAAIVGIPFASANTDGSQSAAALSSFSVSFADVMKLEINKNTTSLTLGETTNAGVQTSLTDVNFSDFSYIQFSLTYRAA
jgi:hypothetical protein